ncbi:unnamed protein product [marine sediment metagenome]|uniref:Uncharacterized protein n=1 Tax=marine sediment metagenome TaxID=412755 RepID=X0YS60_9ZZZZ
MVSSKAGEVQRIQPRIVPDKESGLSEVRFWHEDEFLGIQKVKNSDLNLVYFNF